MSRWVCAAVLLLMPVLAPAVPTAVFSQAPVPGSKVAIVGASVVNVEDGSVIPNAVVLIEGDRIKSVGPAGSVTLRSDVQTIRMDGKWLAPGLLNMHVHFGLK